MKKILSTILLSISFNSLANLIFFSPGDPLSSSNINQNFSHLHSLLNAKQVLVNFPLISSGNESLTIKNNFDLLSGVGLTIPSQVITNGEAIRSRDVNNVFLESQNQINQYINSEITIQVDYGQTSQIQLSAIGVWHFNVAEVVVLLMISSV